MREIIILINLSEYANFVDIETAISYINIIKLGI